jgi:hypothetical protein
MTLKYGLLPRANVMLRAFSTMTRHRASAAGSGTPTRSSPLREEVKPTSFSSNAPA